MRCSICTCAMASCTTARFRADRGRLNRYIASLNAPAVVSGYENGAADQKKAFWINAYNALVLQTVVDHYPIRGTCQGLSGEQHPADSRRVREDAAHDRGKAGHARSDRDHHPRRVQRSARVRGARARSGRQRPPPQRGLQRARRSTSSSSSPRRNLPSRRGGRKWTR